MKLLVILKNMIIFVSSKMISNLLIDLILPHVDIHTEILRK